jgi:hypothetical protein
MLAEQFCLTVTLAPYSSALAWNVGLRFLLDELHLPASVSVPTWKGLCRASPPIELTAALTGDPEALEVHLTLVERDVLIDGHAVKIHCHCRRSMRMAEFNLADWPNSCAMLSQITR